MSENPRQFSSLDYADADMYGALTAKPPTATPLNLPLENLSLKKPSGGISLGEAAYYREEEARRRSLFVEQQEAQASRETALREREIARNLALQQTKPTELEQATVSSRDYEKGFEIPKSTPERQPAPSTGSPPPTPNSTAARANPLVEPTATPAPAALAEPVAIGAGGFAALSKSLPQAAGRFVIPGAFVAGDFAVRVIQGQSVTQAASGAVATTVGTFAGAVVGAAIAGPVGEVIGGYVGGYVAGQASDYFFHSPPNTGTPPVEVPNYPPFRGGQEPGTLYSFSGSYDVFQHQQQGDVKIARPTLVTNVAGPIEGIEFEDGVADDGFFGFKIACYRLDNPSIPTIIFVQGGHPFSSYAANPSISITRADGKPEIYPDKTAPAPPPDNQPYYFAGTPLNGDNIIPSGSPAAGRNKGKNRDVVPGIPANNTPNSTGPYFPGHGGLAPSYLPNPTQTPSNLGGNLPSTTPAPAPPLFAEPKDLPPPRFAPAPGESASAAPGISVYLIPTYPE
ncbi:MAG: hypothetical protein V7L04_31765 [Nostoc sp.]|uniref:hypothetical protein n=1 Tax=Nostoc sp. TaxID=1180 RepID=UPI002FF52ABE